MKATDLAKALNEIDDAYLAELNTTEKELITMKNRKKISRILLAAAVLCLLTITAFAAEQLRIHSFTSQNQEYFDSFGELKQALDSVGLAVDIPEEYKTGFRFQQVRTGEIAGEDDDGNQVATFWDLSVQYQNDQGQQVDLNVHPLMDGIAEEDTRTPVLSKTVRGVTLNYYIDHYKFVPADYVPSEEEEQWKQQPGNYISYGADEVQQQDFASLSWTTEEGNFCFMEMGTSIDPEILFAMAEEILG